MAEQSETEGGEGAVVWGSAYPPSINAGIPKLGELPAGWSRLRMKDMLDVIERPVKLVDSQTYQLVTAKRSRGGIVSRGKLRGDEIKVKQQFEVRSGDFILSNRQIAHGGCGIVPPELDGAVVSGEYTVLHPKPMLDLRFLHYLSHSAYFQQICFHSGVGVHVEKLVFRLQDWLNWQIDIPPLPTQRRIAEVLSDVDRAIELTDGLVSSKERRKRALAQSLFQDLSGNNRPLAEFLVTNRPGIWSSDDGGLTDPSIIRAADFGPRGSIEFDNAPRKRISDVSDELWIKEGDVLLECSGGGPDQPVGRVVRASRDLDAVPSNFVRILRFEGLRPDFAYFALEFAYENSRSLKFQTQTTGIRNLDYKAYLDSISVHTDLIQQTAVAEVLALFDLELATLSAQSNVLRKQKRGLIRELIAGHKDLESHRAEEVAV